jgi:glycosyltransferase involved in cell wall biosynthesis
MADGPRLLFVNHSMDLGGATRSLRGLIRGYPHLVCDLVVPRAAKASDDEIRAYFGPNVRRVLRFWLPFEQCYRGRPPLSRSAPIWAGYALLWRLERARFYRLASDEQYDAIHLNSVVLHPVAREDLPFVVHVREIVDHDLARVRASLRRARGVIFIDEATRGPFETARLPRSIVLNNPIDMTGVGELPIRAADRLSGDPARLTIFSIVGVLMPEKGVDRVIRAFRATPGTDLRLVIVGGGPQERELRQLAASDPRIVFWGVESDVDRVFALSDYVLRGEAYPCIGRTIYEGLYAGCGVIIPGDATASALFEYERFASRVHFYPPGDEAALRSVLCSLAGRKLLVKRGESNVAMHVAGFDAFVRVATAGA